MYDCSTDGPSKARLYIHWTSNQWRGVLPAVAGTDPQAYNHCYSADSLFLCMGNVAAYGTRSQMMALSSVTEVPQSQFEVPYPVTMRTEKPTNEDWRRKQDWERYGSMLGLNSLMTSDTEKAHLIEKQMTHPKYLGDIRDLGHDDIYYRSALTRTHVAGTQIGQYHRYPDKPNSGQVRAESVNDLGYMVYNIYPSGSYNGPYDGYSYDFDGDYEEMTNEIISQGSSFEDRSYLSNTGWLTRKWENIVNKSGKSTQADGYVFDLSYTYTMSWMETSVQCRSIWNVHQYVYVWWTPLYGNRSPNSIQRIPGGKVFHISSQSEVTLADWYTNVGAYTPSYRESIQYGQTALVSLYTRSAQADGSNVPNFVSYRMMGAGYLNRRHTVFKDSVLERMKNIRPAAFLSASDGLTNWKTIIQNNSLQNLQHLKDIAGLLPTLPDLPKLLAKAMRGDISAITDLIDYVTEAVLKFRFQQKPTLDALTEVSEAEYEKRLRQILSPQPVTVYGRFTYQFTDKENWMRDGELFLDVRSKLRVAYDASTLLNGMLMADSLGLLPNLHRVWELLPFSFVIDWFTNMNNRLKSVDDQLTWLAVRSIWTLHSFTTTYRPSADALAYYGLEQIPGGKPFALKVYRREFTLCTPALTESIFDFLRRPRGPDPVTVGALLWQLA